MHHMAVIENKYSITELEQMMPFERDIYLGLLKMSHERSNKEYE